MSKSMKTKIKFSASAVIVTGTALMLSACSSNVTRFDYPAMGYNTADQNMSDFGGGFGGSSSYNSSKTYQSSGDSGVAEYAPARDTSSNQPSAQRYSRENTSRGNVQSEGLSDLSTQRYQPRRISNFSKSAPKTARAVASSTNGDRVTVQSGDTLYSISRRYNMKPADFMTANNMVDHNIRVGQRLSVPAGGQKSSSRYKSQRVASVRSYNKAVPSASKFRYASDAKRGKATSYTVRSGDTLYSVARNHNVSFSQLAQWNGLSSDQGLRIGQVLSLKAGSRQASSVVARAKAKPRLWVAGGETVQKQKPVKIAVVTPKRIVTPQRARRAVPKALKSVPKKIVRKASIKMKKNGFSWPVRGRIITKFGPMANGKNNDGVNFAVPTGTEVRAAGKGVVAYAGSELKGYGNLVLIRHANNFVSAYAHNSALKVKRGDRIKRGDIVALAGKTGDVSQPQLHFELRKGAKPIDPTHYIQ